VALCAFGEFVAISAFAHAWTPIRAGALVLPVLLLCGLGINRLADGLAGLAARFGSREIARFGMLVLLVAFSIHPNIEFQDRYMKPSPVFAMARDLVKLKEPLRVVIVTGEDRHDSARYYFIAMALAEAGRYDEARSLVLRFEPKPDEIDRDLTNWSETTVLIVPNWIADPPMPTVPVRVLRTYEDHTVYEYAGEAIQHKRPVPYPPPSVGPRMTWEDEQRFAW